MSDRVETIKVKPGEGDMRLDRWFRVHFPDVNSDSFFWQISSDNGRTWHPPVPDDDHAVGWKQAADYQWVPTRHAGARQPARLMGDLRTLIRENRRPELYSAGW